MNAIRPQSWWLLAALLVYAVCLTAITWPLELSEFRRIFSEKGPLERASEPLWLLLAAACFCSFRCGKGVGVMGLVAVLCALREADWHYKFTGGSMIKLSWYAKSAAPLEQKIAAGIVALIALAILVWALVFALRAVRRPAVWRRAWMQSAAIGLGVLVGSKLLDRSISMIEDATGYLIGGLPGRMIGAYEEGFEFALPLIFGFALWQYRLRVLAQQPLVERDVAVEGVRRTVP